MKRKGKRILGILLSVLLLLGNVPVSALALTPSKMGKSNIFKK